MKHLALVAVALAVIVGSARLAEAQDHSRPHSRDVGVPFEGQPGPLNAITDVKGVQATEEAAVNAMVAAKTMTGLDGRTVEALPHDKLRAVLKKYNRLAEGNASNVK